MLVTAFEWDEAKRAANLAKHGLDFQIGRRLFDGRKALTRPSPRGDETRHMTIGEVTGLILTLIWTERGETVRMISLRRARDGEKRAYHAHDG